MIFISYIGVDYYKNIFDWDFLGRYFLSMFLQTVVFFSLNLMLHHKLVPDVLQRKFEVSLLWERVKKNHLDFWKIIFWFWKDHLDCWNWRRRRCTRTAARRARRHGGFASFNEINQSQSWSVLGAVENERFMIYSFGNGRFTKEPQDWPWITCRWVYAKGSASDCSASTVPENRPRSK